MLWRMLAMVLIVLVFGAAAIFLARRVLPRIRGGAGKRLSVEETVYIGPKRSLHILRAGSKELLIAAAGERIALLTELGPSDEPQSDTNKEHIHQQGGIGRPTDR